jgi:hypothetical protein
MKNMVTVRSPMRVACPTCFVQSLTIDKRYKPPHGISPDLRLYNHHNDHEDVRCDGFLYVRTCLKDVPADVIRLAFIEEG